MAEWRTSAGMAMRLFLVVFVLGGLGIIIFGCVLEFPPASLPSGGMVAVGVLTVASAIFGYCGSYGNYCCLKTFLSIALISLGLQTSFVLAIHLNFDKVLSALDESKHGNKVETTLKTGKWIFVAILIAESIALLLAMVLHCGGRQEYPFDPLEDPSPSHSKREKPHIALQKIRADIGRTKEDADTSSHYEKVRQKMEMKYGKFSHGVDWGKKKKNRWYFF